MIKIGRAIEGISINGKEYLHMGNDELHFATEDDARNFLLQNGIDEEDLEYFFFDEV